MLFPSSIQVGDTNCQMNASNTTKEPPPPSSLPYYQAPTTDNAMLHQQNSMYCPVSPVVGAPNLLDNPSNQLLRSKSLNDISNESQILAYASNRFINFHQLQQTFYKDPNDNQCSNKPQNTSNAATATNTAAPTNVFNICNPIVMNLNGVTEQIGNLHL